MDEKHMTDTGMLAAPEWTEFKKKNGLDPLGMQNASVNLYQSLLPGISNVTLRLRYYGFYAWLSLSYAKQNGDTNPKTWQRYIRRAEALYALVSQYKGQEVGVAGADWAHRKLNSSTDNFIQFDADAEPDSDTHYLKQAWGAYGAAYASQLFEIGIFSSAEDHVIPVPSPQIGQQIAEVFATELGSVTDKFLNIIKRGSISRVELTELAPISPSAIRADSVEREIYQRLLFAKAGLDRSNDLSRRSTLLLILSLAKQMGKTPSATDVRWALYSSHISDIKDLACSHEDLESQKKRWWVYQANDLTHICFEALLKYSLDTLEPYHDGLPLAHWITDAVEAILNKMDKVPDSWDAFLKVTTPVPNAWSTNTSESEVELTKRLMATTRLEGICLPENALVALKLLAVLHNRAMQAGENVKKELGHLDPNVRSLLTEVRFLDAHRHEKFPILIGRLIEERVIRRHLWVALRKFQYQGDYTFLVESDDGRFRLRVKDGPVFTTPRLAPAITFLKDIHLLDGMGITDLGQELLDIS
jgi:hypothetical protein